MDPGQRQGKHTTVILSQEGDMMDKIFIFDAEDPQSDFDQESLMMVITQFLMGTTYMDMPF